jgi:hypothetical protein
MQISREEWDRRHELAFGKKEEKPKKEGAGRKKPIVVRFQK